MNADNAGGTATPAAHLKVEGISAGYQAGIDILRELSLESRPGAVTVVVGPNGAGKSTLLKAIFGFLHPHQGAITLDGEPIQRLQPYQVKARGISYIPQGTNLFPQMTVEENLKMGAWTFRRDRHRQTAQTERMYDLFPVLRERRRRPAHELSGGQARMLAIAKEVMSGPRLMLVDEPAAGLSPSLSRQVYEFLIATRRAVGATVLLIDQQIEEALEIADEVVLVDLGRVRAQGPRSEMDLPRVRQLIQECLRGSAG